MAYSFWNVPSFPEVNRKSKYRHYLYFQDCWWILPSNRRGESQGLAGGNADVRSRDMLDPPLADRFHWLHHHWHDGGLGGLVRFNLLKLGSHHTHRRVIGLSRPEKKLYIRAIRAKRMLSHGRLRSDQMRNVQHLFRLIRFRVNECGNFLFRGPQDNIIKLYFHFQNMGAGYVFRFFYLSYANNTVLTSYLKANVSFFCSLATSATLN